MKWVEERLEQRRKRESEARAIADSFDTIWGELWEGITKSAAAYRAQCGQFSVITGGSQNRRMIGIPAPLQVVNGVVVEYALQVFIEAVGSHAVKVDDQIYPLASGADGVIYLMVNNEAVFPSELAERIMDPILFPDLQSVEKEAEWSAPLTVIGTTRSS